MHIQTYLFCAVPPGWVRIEGCSLQLLIYKGLMSAWGWAWRLREEPFTSWVISDH